MTVKALKRLFKNLIIRSVPEQISSRDIIWQNRNNNSKEMSQNENKYHIGTITKRNIGESIS